MTEAAANGLIDIGLVLDNDLPLTQAAFAIGDISLAHVRVLCSVIEGVDREVIAQIEERLVAAAKRQNPTRLRQTARRIIARHDPHGDRKRRERRVEDRDVRVRHSSDGVSFLDG